jgi:hypothetical protein
VPPVSSFFPFPLHNSPGLLLAAGGYEEYRLERSGRWLCSCWNLHLQACSGCRGRAGPQTAERYHHFSDVCPEPVLADRLGHTWVQRDIAHRNAPVMLRTAVAALRPRWAGPGLPAGIAPHDRLRRGAAGDDGADESRCEQACVQHGRREALVRTARAARSFSAYSTGGAKLWCVQHRRREALVRTYSMGRAKPCVWNMCVPTVAAETRGNQCL